MTKKWYATIALTLLCISVTAQSIISGQVTDEKGVPLVSAIVRAYPMEGEELAAYCFTNTAGEYSLKISGGTTDLRLQFSMLGHQTVEKRIANKSAKYDIYMPETSIELEDVTVEAPPISSSGDTVVYHMASFSTQADRNIEDVIRKLPGITVDASGIISYKGEPINKFYIEGMDLLNGRYGLATQNISPEDVQSVSIYENHQPQRVLKDIVFSDRAALNLKLKNGSKLHPIGYVEGGGGYGDKGLWKGETFAMLAGTDVQQLYTAKTNNIGQSYQAENALLIGSEQSNSGIADKLFPQDVFESPDIPKERYYRNRSATASGNVLLKLKEDLSLTLNGDYTFDHNKYGLSRNSFYFTGNSLLTLQEKNKASLYNQQAKLFFNVEKNGERLFVKNDLRLQGNFYRNEYHISGNSRLAQELNSNRYTASNRLELTVRKNSRLFRFKSQMSLSNTPMNHICVDRTEMSDTAFLRQNATGLSFHTYEWTSFLWAINSRWQGGAELSFQSAYDKLHTQAMPQGEPDNSNGGYSLETALIPFLNYESGKFKWHLSIPVRLDNIHYNNFTDDTDFHLDRMYIEARSSLHYYPIPGCHLSLTAGSSHTTGDLLNFIIYPIYVTYRDKSGLGDGNLSLRKSIYGTLSLNYRNTMYGNFLTLRGGYRMGKSNLQRGSWISESETVSQFIQRDNRTDIWNGEFYAAKNFHSIDMIIKLTGQINVFKRDVLRQQLIYGMKNTECLADFHLEKNFWNNRMLFHANVGYDYSGQSVRMDETETKSSMDRWKFQANLSVFPLKPLELYVSGIGTSTEQLDGRHRRNTYINAGIRWIKPAYEIELSLSNLTNEDSYSVYKNVLSDVFYYQYSLRPCEGMLTFKYNF